MLHLKQKTVGIDTPIQQFQEYAYPSLLKVFGITPLVNGLPQQKYQSYGRAYRNQAQEGYQPHVYTVKSDYKPLQVDDRLIASSFFGVADRRTDGVGQISVNTHLIFFVNLTKIPSTVSHRNDEEVRNAIYRILTNVKGIYGFTLTETVTGIDTVMAEYPGWDKVEGMKFRDMHPFHCFRFNFQLNYQQHC